MNLRRSVRLSGVYRWHLAGETGKTGGCLVHFFAYHEGKHVDAGEKGIAMGDKGTCACMKKFENAALKMGVGACLLVAATGGVLLFAAASKLIARMNEN